MIANIKTANISQGWCPAFDEKKNT